MIFACAASVFARRRLGFRMLGFVFNNRFFALAAGVVFGFIKLISP